MKKLRLYSIVSIILFFLVSSTSYGHSINQEIKVFFKDIKIMINNKEVIAKDKVFLYNNTVYVPLRSLAESLSYNVHWDENSSSISITEKPKNIIPTQPDLGEVFVHGKVLGVYTDQLKIIIKQHADDSNTIFIDPEVKISPQAIIEITNGISSKRGNISDLKQGDGVAIILDFHRIARAVIIYRNY